VRGADGAEVGDISSASPTSTSRRARCSGRCAWRSVRRRWARGRTTTLGDEFPMFEGVDEDGHLMAAHHPLRCLTPRTSSSSRPTP